MVVEEYCKEENVEAFILCGPVTSENMVESVKGSEKGAVSRRSKRRENKAAEYARITG